ncbi:serine hydrolase domain-containing protein [Sphingomonas prati]|uniref:CubicO group peptidase (Beta-lactamase class C family) n=1 Tax=Sphingomonas prati TaxID=1843237 RepID=A0A7W9BRX0_9SPHN|nr:serine hydrolase domain-containing protein [Sphingomonas prati]MBB5728970.1 CubicO group peptidase (beta-lactamase class C family) [Sphingomonas prati]
MTIDRLWGRAVNQGGGMRWAVAAACCASGALAAEPVASPARVPDRQVAMNRVMAVAASAGLAGEIVLADRDGPILDRVRGAADRERGRAHRVGDRWLWASVTKQVVAVLVMQQVEAGTLALDGTIRRYLPDWPGAAGDRITVRQLLQHQSGLPNPNETPPNADEVPAFYLETGARIGDRGRAYGICAGSGKPAGAGFSYNNCDYLVLAAILERVSGKSFAALVAERIARPLGLRTLRMAGDRVPWGGAAAIGYTAGGKRYPAINVATYGAAGGLTGSARDLAAFDRALIAGTLLSAESRAVLWRGDPKLGYQALGVWSFRAPLAGCAGPVTLIERRGDVAGTQVRNVIAPALGRSVAVFTNDDSVDFGEIWQGKGLSHALLSAAFCPPVG